MLKRVRVCDKCGGNIASAKCYMCGKDICRYCGKAIKLAVERADFSGKSMIELRVYNLYEVGKPSRDSYIYICVDCLDKFLKLEKIEGKDLAQLTQDIFKLLQNVLTAHNL